MLAVEVRRDVRLVLGKVLQVELAAAELDLREELLRISHLAVRARVEARRVAVELAGVAAHAVLLRQRAPGRRVGTAVRNALRDDRAGGTEQQRGDEERAAHARTRPSRCATRRAAGGCESWNAECSGSGVSVD